MTTWVLLRGLAREARHWGDFVPALRGLLPPDHALLAPDLPGNGRRWREASPTTVEQLVHEARRELSPRRHRPPFVLVALSLGGMVAVQWAAADPARVAGCVLINSSLGGWSPFWQRLRPDSYPALAGLLLPGRSALARERAILHLTSSRRPAVAEHWAAYAGECPVTRLNVLRQLAAAARYRAPVQAPRVPLLVLASAQDRLVSPRCSHAIARGWGAALREHPTAGHDLPLDAPEWTAGQIAGWEALRLRG